MMPEHTPRGLGDLYDLSTRLRRPDKAFSGFELQYVPLVANAAHFVRQAADKEEAKALLRNNILDCARPLSEIAPKAYNYNGTTHVAITRSFIKALEKFERHLYIY